TREPCTRSNDPSAATSPPPSPACTGGWPARPRCRCQLSVAGSVREGEPPRRVQLCLLDRLGRVNAFGTDHGALADEAALPDAVRVGKRRQSLLGALVARVEVVPACQRDCRRAEELVVEPVNGAGRVAEHAVDALAELAEVGDLLHRLPVL